jgi:RNA-directed DNA polymerase
MIKNKLKVKYYTRYLDDSIIIVQTKEEAKKCLKEIVRFLHENLKLQLNKKTQIFIRTYGIYKNS